MKTKLSLIMSAVICAACNSSDNSRVVEDVVNNDTQQPVVVEPVVGDAKYTKISKQAITTRFKTGIAASLKEQSRMEVGIFTDTAPSALGFSTTNTQEQGVAESDRVKYDGDYMYVVDQGYSDVGTIRVLKRDEENQLKTVNVLNTPVDGFAGLNDIYLSDESHRLASVMRNPGDFVMLERIWPGPNTSKPFDVSVFDISQPENASLLANVSIEGQLIDSRRIENYVYLVTAFAPTVTDWIYNPTEEQEEQNKQLLADMAIEDLLPKYRIDKQDYQPLYDAEECFVTKPEAATGSNDESKDEAVTEPHQVISVVRVDLTTPENVSALCVMGSASDIYVSQQNIYLLNDLYQSTEIDKFSLSPALDYQASGEVSGSLGWDNPSFRLSEYQDELRVVHSDYSESPTHQLSVLVQNDTELAVRASLPNDTDSTPIGKPNEDIYAVRFFGERAYIVTFERVDPLYVIDIPVAEAPVIVGALEVPGYSSYLHPLSNNFLLGIGQDVETVTTESGDIRNISVGMKVSLFDINNPVAPVEIATLIKDNGYTPVEFDHRALAVLKQDDDYRFAIPMEQQQACEQVCMALYQPRDSIVMLEVDTADGSMNEIRQWGVEDSKQQYISPWLNRAIIHKDESADLVYFLRGNSVFSTSWSDTGDTQGPY